jgi:hypothetical protein
MQLMGAMDAQLISQPRYSTLGDSGIDLPSCSAFFTPTSGCCNVTSTDPATAPAPSSHRPHPS